MTRILTRSDLLSLLNADVCLRAMRRGFLQAAAGVAAHKVVADLPFPGVATALLPGVLPGIPAYTVKVNAKFPDAVGPALRGLVCLHSGQDGELLAVLDSATVTTWRTGLSAALATDLLAPADPAGEAIVGVIGAGAQSEMTLTGLARLRSWRRLLVHDTRPERATAFAERHDGQVVETAGEVAAGADIVVLATWPTRPVLDLAATRPGQHLTSLGSDEAGKRELATDVLVAADVYVDDLALARSVGALAADGAPRSAVTLAKALAGHQPPAPRGDRRTVYAPVGLPWQDLALAWTAFQAAQACDAGATVDWLG
ncbi:ornithine cyclodeaminase family protein [Streptomyces zagrosensis]|uniref:Ornithine cyclodeaminase n=1 Tax=Streptomyces zagrosensis TaxID=1042984 RepID=A0A7W9QD04_9ACTN|nr:NAD(P)-binding domain-containing protein [Streptomyces zagrosensis]MBB5937834.1 ornithine cyclodeaminase [Streptomyces zagrosensis]